MGSEAWLAAGGVPSLPWWLDPWVAAALAALGAGLALGQGVRALASLARHEEVPARRGVLASVSMSLAAAFAAVLLAGPGSVRLAEPGLPLWTLAVAGAALLGSVFPRAAGLPLLTVLSLGAVVLALLALPLHPAAGRTALASALPVSVREDGVRLSFETTGPNAVPVTGALELGPGPQRLVVDLLRLRGPLAAFFGPARWRLRSIEGPAGVELHRFPSHATLLDAPFIAPALGLGPVRLPFMTAERVGSPLAEPRALDRRAWLLEPDGAISDSRAP